MSLKIKKERTRILSPYRGQNSFISDIKKKRFYKVKSNDKGSDIPVEIEKDITTYNIFFDIDMRLLLASGAQVVEFSIIKAPTLKSIGMFGLMGSLNEENVASSLYMARKEAGSVIAEDIKRKTIYSEKIDLTKRINSVRFSKDFRNRTDEELFGKIKKIKLVDPKSLSRKNFKNIRLASTTVSVSDIEKTSGVKSFSDAYKDSICNNMDPALAFQPVQNTIGLSPKMSNTNIGKLSNFTNQMNIVDINTLRSKFVQNSKKLNTSIGDISNSKERSVGVVVKEPNRVQTMSHKFDIESSLINSHELFLVLLQIRDPITGMLSENFEFKVNHRINVENYYIPEFLPNISIIRNKHQKGFSKINGIIENVDSKIKDIDTVSRLIYDDFNLAQSKFSDPQNINEIDQIKNQSCFKLSNISQVNMHQMRIIRSISTTVAGLRISNISSDSVRGENFKYINSGIHAFNMEQGIGVRYFADPTKVAGVTICRKLRNEKHYTPVSYSTENTWGPGGINDAKFIGNPPGSQISKKSETIAILDSMPKMNEIFDYRLRLFLKNGGDEYSNSIATIKRIVPLNFIKVKIDSTKISSTKGSEQSTVTFSIDFEMEETSSDKILSILRSLGNESIFESTVDVTKTSLSDICIFSVDRVNISTSQVDFLGYHKAGEFTDTSSIVQGNSYIYYVTAHLANADLVKKGFQQSVLTNKNIIASIRDIRMPSMISKIQNAEQVAVPPTDAIGPSGITSATSLTALSERYSFLKSQKAFSYESLVEGMIFTNTLSKQSYKFSKYNTGDYSSINIDISSFTYEITGNEGIEVTRSNMGAPVIRFSLSPTDNSKIDTLDCVVITCIKNGKESICGACHSDGSGIFTFIDYTSKNHYGAINYFATPITVAGFMGPKSLISSNILTELRPSEIKA